jgi:hypothetical protein
MSKKKPKSKPSKPAAQSQPKVQAPIVTPYPTAGEKITEFEARLDAQLGADGGGAARGPGRPHKEQVSAERAEQTFDERLITQVVCIPFDLWALSQGVPQLKLRDEEAALIGPLVKELLDHYLPIIPSIAYAWISLSIAMYATMKPRLELIQALKKEKPSASSTPRPAAAQSSPSSAGAPASALFPSEIKPEKM